MKDFYEFLKENYKYKRQSVYYLIGMLGFLIVASFLVIEGIEYAISTWKIPYIKTLINQFGVPIWIIKLGILAIPAILGFYKWTKWRSIPVLKTSKVGIYLVPYFPDKDDSDILNRFIIRFKRDLVLEIGDIAEIESIDDVYFVEELSSLYENFIEGLKANNQKQIKKIEDRFDKLRLKCNVSYILYFDCLRRNEGALIEIGNIRSIALHPKTSLYNQEILRRDLTLSVPRGLDINTSNERDELNGVIGVLGPHIAYITSVTYFLNKSYDKCIENAKKALIYKGERSKVHDRASSMASQAYVEIANLKLKEMYKEGNFLEIDIYIENINNAAKFKHNSYSISLLLGIGYFLKSFNTAEARRALKKGIGPQTTGEEWMISLSFLDLWDGKNTEAIKRIEEINWVAISNPILLANILEFNEGVKKVKNRYEMDVWGAVISKKMGDIANFGYYLDKINHKELDPILNKYLEEIDK